MKKLIPILLLLLLPCGCESLGGGSSTSQRPALNKPAISPDGAYWDATEIARRKDREAFLFLLSPQFLHRALFPDVELSAVKDQEEFDAQRRQIQQDLEPYKSVVDRMATAYMKRLAGLMDNKFIEVNRPRYDIDFTDDYDRAEGPNKASVTVKVCPKGPTPDDFEPEAFDVNFIMDGRRWLINGMNPDPLKGSFTR